MWGYKNMHVLKEGECLRDLFFDWTESINDFFVSNQAATNHYIIYSNALVDLSQLSCIYLYWRDPNWKTHRSVFATVLFMVPRLIIQSNFILGRMKGFLWFYPGVWSITVSYHDINDFFYSGHVGIVLLQTHEQLAFGYEGLGWTGILSICNIFVMMIVLRTHYIIDLVAGLIIGLWAV